MEGSIPPMRPNVPRTACSTEIYHLMENCWAEFSIARPAFSKIKDIVRKIVGRGTGNVVDYLLERMEQYSNNLEGQVAEKTEQFMEEKARSEELLGQLLPKYKMLINLSLDIPFDVSLKRAICYLIGLLLQPLLKGKVLHQSRMRVSPSTSAILSASRPSARPFLPWMSSCFSTIYTRFSMVCWRVMMCTRLRPSETLTWWGYSILKIE